MKCPNCSSELPPHAAKCPICGVRLRPGGDDGGGDFADVFIPRKNPKALTAYYLGIFSIIPMLGIILGIAAVILGVMGLQDRRANPSIRGGVHAGIGIGCGGLCALLWIAAIMIVALGALFASAPM